MAYPDDRLAIEGMVPQATASGLTLGASPLMPATPAGGLTLGASPWAPATLAVAPAAPPAAAPVARLAGVGAGGESSAPAPPPTPPRLVAATQPSSSAAASAEDPIQAARAALALQQYRQAMRGSPGAYREAQWIPRDTVEQYRQSLSPETQAGLEEVVRERGAAEIATAEAERKVAEATAVAAERQATEDIRAVEADRARRQAIDAQASELLRQHDAEMAAIAKEQINPSRWFHSKSSDGKIMAALGMVMFGFGGGDVRGLIKDLSDKDIEAQKASIELRGQGARAKITAYEELMSAYGSPQAAEAALRERQALAVKQRLDAVAAKMTTTDVARAQIEQARYALEEEIATQRAKFEEASLSTIEQRTAYDPGGYVGGKAPDLAKASAALGEYQQLVQTTDGDPYSVGLEGLTPQQKAAETNARVSRAVQLENGDVVFAPTELEGRELRDKYAMRRQVVGNLQKIQELMDRRKQVWRASGEGRRLSAEIDVQIADATDAMRKSLGTGAAMSEQEYDTIKPFIGFRANEWGTYLTGRGDVARDQISRAIETLENKQESDLARTSKSPVKFVPYRTLRRSKEAQ